MKARLGFVAAALLFSVAATPDGGCFAAGDCAGRSPRFLLSHSMKPFLRQTLDRQLLRLHELDALLSASDVVSDLDRFRALTREHAEASVVAEQYNRLTRREDDSKLSVKIPALGAGQTRVIPIGDGAIGAATYDGTLTLQHAGDDSWVAGINMETKVNSEIRVGYQREHLYLDRHVLEFQI